jgi:hypothetical protein
LGLKGISGRYASGGGCVGVPLRCGVLVCNGEAKVWRELESGEGLSEVKVTESSVPDPAQATSTMRKS